MLARLSVLLVLILATHCGKSTLAVMPSILEKQKGASEPTVKQRSQGSEERVPSDPFGLQKYITKYADSADLDLVWKALHVDSSIPSPGRCGCKGYDCNGTCDARFVPGSGRYRILRISYAGEADCWYLVFSRYRAEWRLLGTVSTLDNRYRPPRERIEQIGRREFLVINELWGRGTGVLGYGERWYLLHNGRPTNALAYPVMGHNVQGGTGDYQYSSKLSFSRSDNLVRIEYKIFTQPVFRQPNRLFWRMATMYTTAFRWSRPKSRFLWEYPPKANRVDNPVPLLIKRELDKAEIDVNITSH